MNKEIKNQILKYIDEIKNNSMFWENITNKNSKNKNSNKEALGSTNIKKMATIALEADCYKELELYISYKIARGNGWEKNFKDNKKFGEVILEYMDKIKKLSDTEEEALSNISKFFGYLYWFRKSIEKGGK